LDAETLEKLIKNGKPANPVYIFGGPEVFLKNKMFALMINKLVPPEERQENVFKCICSGKVKSEILDSIYGFSFNLSPKLFYIQDFESLPTKQRKEFTDALHENGIPPNTIIIFTSSDQRTSNELATKFKQQADKIDFWTPFANKLPSWVKSEMSNQGAEITSDAADLLIELLGSDLSILYQEITKLALANKGKIINLPEVKKSVSYQKQNSIYDFLNAFTSRDIKSSVKSLESLIKRGEAPQKLWFILSKQVREIRLFHDISKDRPDILAEIKRYLTQYSAIANRTDYKSNQEKKEILATIQEKSEEIPETIVKSLGLRNQTKIKSLHYALNFKHSELIKLWPELLKTDLDMKSGTTDPATLLTTFIHKSLSA